MTFSRHVTGLAQGIREAAVLCALALSGASLAWALRPASRLPLIGTAADLLEWRARIEGIETVRLPAALEEVRRGDRIWLDVRSLSEQGRGRIPWAIPFPSTQLSPHAVDALPPVEPDRPIVLYCGSPTCDWALRVAVRLKASGYSRVAVFVDGFSGWVSAGGEIEAAGGDRLR